MMLARAARHVRYFLPKRSSFSCRKKRSRFDARILRAQLGPVLGISGEPPMEMSFAQALNDAKQVIVQQSNRIKADAEKTRQQQQTIVDQCAMVAKHEATIKEQATEIVQQAEQIQSLEANLTEATIAREQAEAIIDRQGQRLTTLQEQVAGLERKTAEQTSQIERLTFERDNYL